MAGKAVISLSTGLEDPEKHDKVPLKDALFVVDVVLALSSRSIVNGVDPVLFPVTGAVLRRLVEEAERRGEARTGDRP